MKVFILYASAGAGHKKAAQAVYDYLKSSRPDLELSFIDILDYSNPVFKFLASSGYIFLITNFPWVWYFLYRSSRSLYKSGLRIFFDYISCVRLLLLVKKENPDIIISTHFLSSTVVTVGKSQGWIKSKLITIITDYCLHPFWIADGVDSYIVSSIDVKKELLKYGVEEGKIKIYGIPVDAKFYSTLSREAVAKKLEVDYSSFTVLIMTGAIGIGPIEEVVKALVGSAQMLVVCGRNSKLYGRLAKLNVKQVKVYPLVNNVDELMSVSDIVLTKAGGLTITESLIKNLPMVFFSSIPGLETANASVICKYGAAFRAEYVQRIKKIVLFLKDDRFVYQETVDKIAQLRKKDTLQMVSSEIPIS